MTRIDDMERRGTATPVGHSMPDLAAAAYEFRLAPFLAHVAGLPGADADVSREIEVSREYASRSGNKDGWSVPFAALLPPAERRVLLYGAGSGSGAGVVFESQIPDSIAALRPRMVMGQRGATIIDGLTGGPVAISKITAGKTAEFVAENTAGTPQDPTTGKVELQPHHAISLGSWSKNMLLQSSPSAQAFLRDDCLASVLGAIDRVAIAGGAGAEPDGIWAQVASSALGVPEWNDILEIIEATEIANVPGASLGWILHPSAVRVLRGSPKLTVGSPPSFEVGGFIMDEANNLAGYSASSTTFVPTIGSPVSEAGLIFGDFAQCVLGIFESVTFDLNPYSEAEFRRGNVAYRAQAAVDVALRHSEAFETRTVNV